MALNASDKLIGSLAIFKSDLVENDFISSYIPFVATALLDASKTEDKVDIHHISRCFEELFGFSIDRAPMTAILNKCAKKGLIEKKNNATYAVNKECCLQRAISDEKLSVQKEHYQAVVEKLIWYYAEMFDINVLQETVEVQLLKFLSENSAKTLIVKLNISAEDQTTKQHSYIISRFVQWCRDNDRNIYRLILDLAMGYLMSSALAYDSGYDEQTQKSAFRNMVIYFDTPFLLRVLGLNDLAMQEAAVSMLEQLRELNAIFRIFAHTYDETMQILKDCVRWIENDSYDEFHASLALRTFVHRNFTKADVQQYVDTMQAKLDYYKISVDDEDYYAGKYYSCQIDEEAIEDSIVTTYKRTRPNFNPKKKESTIAYDVKSISAIFKLWNKKTARTYSQAKYVFLTTNATLSYITRQYSHKINPNSQYSVYPCITDVYLGTNIWLSAPVKKIESFSEKKLMADCMSIIEPSETLIQTLQDYINRALEDKTITDAQYHLLKQKAFDNDYVMNRTLSDETKFTDKIMEELLDEIENEIKAPLNERIRSLEFNLAEQQLATTSLESELNAYKNRQRIEQENQEQQDQQLWQLAGKMVEKISTGIVTGIIIPVLSFISGLCGVVSAKITVTSALLVLILAISATILKQNFWNCKCKLIGFVYKYYQIKQFKKTL